MGRQVRNLPPLFGWGSLIGAAPPNLQFPGWLNINHTQDVAGSLTKIVGRHTFKAGAYLNHSYKAQNTGAGGLANLSFQGYVNFGNSTTNALDRGFGYSNAATGVFTEYLQASKFIEGDMIYNQIEGFLQDNWKVTNRLTVDYGLRLVHQGPQYDQNETMSNFFSNYVVCLAGPRSLYFRLQQRRGDMFGQHSECAESPYRADCNGGGRGEYAGADRDARSGNRQRAERDRGSGSWDRKYGLRLARAGGRAAVWLGL